MNSFATGVVFYCTLILFPVAVFFVVIFFGVCCSCKEFVFNTFCDVLEMLQILRHGPLIRAEL